LTVPLLAILLIGLMARNFVGRWLLEFGEGTLSKIPVAGAVYKTLKQLLETFLSNKSNRFRRVVLVEYPREGLYSVGFVTGDVGPSLQPELKEKLLSVFIPTAPNPTTGWYTLVPESSVKDLDISVEDAFRTIISAGIVNPDEKNNTTNPTFSKLFSQLRASTNTSSLLMHNRSLSRELSLISLVLIKDKGDFKINKYQIEEIIESALDSLINHCREE